MKAGTRIWLAALVALAALAGGCGGGDSTPSPAAPPSPVTSSPAQGVATFTSQDPPFSVSYPETWAPIEGQEPGDAAIQATGANGESMNVTLQRLVGPTQLADYTAQSIDALESTGLTVAKSGSGELDGTPASVVESSSDKGPGFRLLQTFAIQGDLVYVVTYAAPPNVFDEAQAQAITDSFRFGA